jgi:hypothetical protein
MYSRVSRNKEEWIKPEANTYWPKMIRLMGRLYQSIYKFNHQNHLMDAIWLERKHLRYQAPSVFIYISMLEILLYVQACVLHLCVYFVNYPKLENIQILYILTLLEASSFPSFSHIPLQNVCVYFMYIIFVMMSSFKEIW